MANRRLSVRKIKEILRLKLDCGISEREISRSCQISRSTVADYLRRAAAARLSWPEASAMAEAQLEERLFPTEHIPSSVKRPPPDCEHIYNELRTYRKFNLTLSQLWLEYKEKHPDGRELFETTDRPNTLPLPQRPYEYAEWYKARVQLNYHIEVDHHYYSVPYQLLHERLDIRLTAAIIEAFHKGERVAAHTRSYAKGGYTTLPEHMPPSHRYYAEWNPARFIQWAGKTGEATARLVEAVLAGRPYPEQGYKACLGIINLTRDYEPVRVEAAARRALKFKTCSYRSLKAILSAGLDRQPDNGEQHSLPGLPPHQNIRGQEYYQ